MTNISKYTASERGFLFLLLHQYWTLDVHDGPPGCQAQPRRTNHKHFPRRDDEHGRNDGGGDGDRNFGEWQGGGGESKLVDSAV